MLETHGIDITGDEKYLHEAVKTALTGKSAGAVKAFLADICVRAVNAVGLIEDGERFVDLDDIKVEKRQGGSIKASTLQTESSSTKKEFMQECPDSLAMQNLLSLILQSK